ncbi:hypothetical protein [Sinorhizobium fredii]|uniref:hypothetical protein n=1 Tax=Rhizobium fredii TaxID=380 RepID=UPI0005955E04|nr:hypothetical protein [Sinorhizobium fredii]WOS62162.1 hypothetical protein SFGR64A_14665 [Sinorhizobium fredii GR64]
MTEKHHAALGWAFLHQPTREAFRRSTGEDIAPALDRYRQWLEANVIGPCNAPATLDDAEAA